MSNGDANAINELDYWFDDFMKDLNLEGFIKISIDDIVRTFNTIDEFTEYCDKEGINGYALSNYSYYAKFGNKYMIIIYEIEYSEKTEFYPYSRLVIDNCGELEVYGIYDEPVIKIVTEIYNEINTDN